MSDAADRPSARREPARHPADPSTRLGRPLGRLITAAVLAVAVLSGVLYLAHGRVGYQGPGLHGLDQQAPAPVIGPEHG